MNPSRNRKSRTTNPKRFYFTRAILISAVVSGVVSGMVDVALAVKPQQFKHTTSEDFAMGEAKQVLITNFGELRLGRSLAPLLTNETLAAAGSVDAIIVRANGQIVFATSFGGKIVVRDKDKDKDKSTVVADLGETAAVMAMCAGPENSVVIGSGGEEAKLHVLLADNKLAELLTLPDAQYIYGIVRVGELFYVATGPEANLYEVDLKLKTSRLVRTFPGVQNLLALATDGKNLFVGTDTLGLIYRIDPATGKGTVLYDADETEIGAIVVDPAGNVFVGTSQLVEPTEPQAAVPAVQAPTTGEATTTTSTGRPESPSTAAAGNDGAATAPVAADVLNLPANPPATAPNAVSHAIPGAAEVEPNPTPIPGPNPTPNPAPEPAPLPKPEPAPEPSPEPGEIPGEQPGEAPNPDAGADKPTNHGAGHAAVTPAVPQQGEAAANGNAIYRISREGFVSEIWREPTMVIDLLIEPPTNENKEGNLDGKSTESALIAATGPGGKIVRILPRSEETSTIADPDVEYITALARDTAGVIYVGTGTSAGLYRLQNTVVETGSFVGPVLDAGQISTIGRFGVEGALPPGSSIKLSARVGNVKDVDSDAWSDWTPDVDARRSLDLKLPAARFVQYRLTLTSAKDVSPVVDQITIAYQAPNLPPRISSVQAVPATGEAGKPTDVVNVTWEAVDPNDDEVRATVLARLLPSGPWLPVITDFKETTYAWDTRSVTEGRYEVRVELSDDLANAIGTGRRSTRVSDPVVIDRTGPVIGDIKQTKPAAEKPAADKVGVEKAGDYVVKLRVADLLGTVQSLEWSINGSADWQTALPDDTLADSPDETYTLRLAGASINANGGSEIGVVRVLSIRAKDDQGREGFAQVVLQPGK